MAETIEDKIAKLPTWARQHIATLKSLTQPNIAEIRQARAAAQVAQERLRSLEDRYQAVMEVVKAAAVGGHWGAKALVERILADYSPEDADDLLTAPMWLVWSNEHAAWWSPQSAGYCWDINAAGRYTIEDALEICKARGVKRGDGINPPELIQPSPEWYAKRLEIIQRGNVNGLVEKPGLVGDGAGDSV